MPPTLPNRDTLRAAYDDVVREIDASWDAPKLTNAFYSSVADVVFDACYRAVSDHCAAHDAATALAKPPETLHAVSAPAGSGKTTFSAAFIVALVRLSEANPEAPYGCTLVVDQIRKADEMFRFLDKLIPGKVAVWTTAHNEKDRRGADTELGSTPVRRFAIEALRRYQVAIVTHALYGGRNAHHAQNVWPHGRCLTRALTIIDEQPKEVALYALNCSHVEAVLEYVAADEGTSDAVKKHVANLAGYIREHAEGPRDLYRPRDVDEARQNTEAFLWFRTKAAEEYATKHQAAIPTIKGVFKYAEALSDTRAFITRSGKLTHFIGYEGKPMRGHGMVLLDATADVDGVAQICPERDLMPVPVARYDNLSVVCVPSITREKMTTFLKHVKKRCAYVEHMQSVITAHMQPGERGLVVCKKALFDNENVPTATRDSPWNIGGRLLATTHWGVGIGRNSWADADVVFLFDEFHMPRRTAIGITQGLKGHKVTEGSLAAMSTQRSKSPDVDAIAEGNLLRWSKQMALRGNARNFDEHGVCGRQKLVFMGDVSRLLSSKERLFPGAKVHVITNKEATAAHQSYEKKLYELLCTEGHREKLTTNFIGQQLGVRWGDISGSLMSSETVQNSIGALGWCYIRRRGRGGCSFERVRAEAHAIAA